MPHFFKSLSQMLVFSFFGMTATESHAQTHPSEPAVNLGDTSFLDGIAGPGLLVEEMADANHSSQVFDGNGHPIAGAAGSYSISGITHVAWLSSRSLLGALYGVEVVQAVAHVDAGPGKNAAGAGDLLLSLSSHAFDVHPYYAATLLPSRHLETSWRVHYLWNATNNNPSVLSGARSTQAGQAIHFNATVGCRLRRGIWVGANGYYLKQITSPQVNGQSLDNSPEQVGGVGPGAMWDLGTWILYANAYHEVGAVNRPQGNKIVLRLQWIPGKKEPAGSSGKRKEQTV